MSADRAKLFRAGLAGLGCALVAGAVYLVIVAQRAYRMDCPELSAEECMLEQQAASEMARWQSLIAVALACGAVADLPDAQGAREEERGLGDPDRLDVDELADAVGQLAAVAGALHAAERQPRVGGHHAVDEDHARPRSRR